MNEMSAVISGGQPISGTVRVAGFKHALVLAIAYAVGASQPIRLLNVPDILETDVYEELLPQLGVKVQRHRNWLRLDPGGGLYGDLPETSRQIHGGLYLVPAILARTGRVRFTEFGGCRIGDNASRSRPWRHVVRVAELFGARFIEHEDSAELRAPRLRGTEIDLRDFTDDPATLAGPEYSGATKSAILTAALAEGTSVLRHPYLKMEVLALLDLLRVAGVAVQIKDDTLVITGGAVTAPASGELEFRLPADLVEVVTWTTIAATTGGSMLLKGVSSHEIDNGLAAERTLWKSAGIELRHDENGLHVCGPQYGGFGALPAIETLPSSIYSDSQPLFAVLACRCPGKTHIVDTVWTSRYAYQDGLAALGAEVEFDARGVRIGRSTLRAPQDGIEVAASDLRCAAALLVAALTAKGGPVTIHGVQHLRRGYDHIFDKIAGFSPESVIQMPCPRQEARC